MKGSKDLRDFLALIKKKGGLKTLSGVDWKLELGAITLCSQEEKEESPAILFDNIKGYPAGYSVLVNSLWSLDRSILALGLPAGLKPLDYVKMWKEKQSKLRTIPPIMVKDGPLLENVDEGNAINVLKFPAPLWNQHDGGRYIGTGSVDITRDPEEGWVNLGTYRVMIHDEKTLGFYITPGHQGYLQREKYFSKGKPCKVAVSLGHEPLIYMAGTMSLDWGLCEYDWIGAVKGEPVQVIEGPFTGLPLPATAEIVIEGESLPGETRMEGPFGEWTGYYGSSTRPEPVIHVTRVMYRNDPIILGEPPGRMLWGRHHNFRAIMDSALIWEQIEKAGLTDVHGVFFAPGGGLPILIVSLKQKYRGHAKQAGMLASSCHAGAYMNRYTIVVDDDIDPADYQQVTWALATRSDPAKSIDIIHRTWSSALDPVIPLPEKGHNSRAIIEACKPFEWIKDFPAKVEVEGDLKTKYNRKWRKSIFGN